MKRLFNLFLIGSIFALLMSACNEDSTNSLDPNLENDEAVVSNLSESDEEDYFLDWGIDDESEDNMFGDLGNGALSKVSSDTPRVRFGRIITERGIRQVNIRRIARDTIHVSLTRQFNGRFVTLMLNDSTGQPERQAKRLRHLVNRNAVYVKKENVADHPHRGWELSSVSLGQGNSVPTATIRIYSVTITTSLGDSITFTHPLETMLDIPEDILKFVQGEEVTVTVKLNNTTANPVDPFGTGATETVLLHHGRNRDHHGRKRLRYVGTDHVSGTNVYRGSWTIQREMSRVFHAIIDAIDNGTIYEPAEDVYPYNSTTWGAPYRIVASK